MHIAGPELHFFKGMYIFMRIYHRYSRTTGYFHTLRTVQNRTNDEAKGWSLFDFSNSMTTFSTFLSDLLFIISMYSHFIILYSLFYSVIHLSFTISNLTCCHHKQLSSSFHFFKAALFSSFVPRIPFRKLTRTPDNMTVSLGILLSIAEMFDAACKPYGFSLRVLQCNLDR